MLRYFIKKGEILKNWRKKEEGFSYYNNMNRKEMKKQGVSTGEDLTIYQNNDIFY